MSSTGEVDEEEELDILGFLDEFFESFIQNSTFNPLKKRTKNSLAAAQAMVGAAKQNLGDTVGDDTASK